MINSTSVFVVSGGGRGIAAQCIIKLTQHYQCKSILLGRSSATSVEPNWARDCFDEAELKKRIVQDFLSQGEKPTPMTVQKVWNDIVSRREIAKTLQAIEQAGGQTEYLSVDITNLSHLQTELAAATKRLGSITGIVHGAGNLADKLIEKKTEQDFEKVYAAKVKGLENLLHCISADRINYLVLFSSVAGFFGSAGQTDYAIANEILNKSAHLIKRHHPKCHVVAINWGPWDSGMVTPELKKALINRNIKVIPIELGTEMLLEELTALEQPAQIIISSPIPVKAAALSSNLQTYRIRRKLTLEANPFLEHHCIGNYPVLPSTCAASWMINACERLYSGFKFFCMEDFKVLKGIVFDRTQPDEFVVDIKEIVKKSFEVVFEVLVWSEKSNKQINLHHQRHVKFSAQLHYSSQVKIQQKIPDTPSYYDGGFNKKQENRIAGHLLYQNRTLFHGPCFQGIDWVLNLNSNKLTAQCTSTQGTERQHGQFPIETFNPYIADVLCQTILIWLKNFSYAPSLLLGIQKIEQFKKIEFEDKYYVSMDIKSLTENTVVANVTAHDAQEEIYLKLSNVRDIK